MNKLDDSFLTYASDILAETNSGLSGMKIVEYCNSYAITFNRIIPYGSYPFDAPNKRTALKENLKVFVTKCSRNVGFLHSSPFFSAFSWSTTIVG